MNTVQKKKYLDEGKSFWIISNFVPSVFAFSFSHTPGHATANRIKYVKETISCE